MGVIDMLFISAGGVWLGIFGLLVLAGAIFSIEHDNFFTGVVVIFLSVLVSQFVFAIPVFATIMNNPLMIALYLAGYTAIGTAYAAFWKMPNFLSKHAGNIKYDYKSWVSSTQKLYKESPDVSYETFLNSYDYKYSVKRNVDVVASWVLLWPAGMIWELSHKPLIWVWNKAYFSIGKSLERLNKNIATKILEKNDK